MHTLDFSKKLNIGLFFYICQSSADSRNNKCGKSTFFTLNCIFNFLNDIAGKANCLIYRRWCFRNLELAHNITPHCICNAYILRRGILKICIAFAMQLMYKSTIPYPHI